MGWQGTWYNHKWERNASTVDDIYKKLAAKPNKEALGQLLLAFMTPNEIMEVFQRMIDQNVKLNRQPKLSDLNKAQLIMAYPLLEHQLDIEDFTDNMKIALARHDFKRFIGYLDINLLTREQIKHFLDPNKPYMLKYVMENMDEGRMQELFTILMWKTVLKRYPTKAKLIDIKTIRNQTELRRFVNDRPSILKYATVDDMKNCVIKGPTWVRIVAQLTPKQRRFIPVGFKEWAERDIFKEMLKGKKFKRFPAGWDNGLVDAEAKD